MPFSPLAFFLKIFVNCARNISRMYSKVKKYARKNVVAIEHVFASLWAQTVEFRHQKLTLSSIIEKQAKHRNETDSNHICYTLSSLAELESGT